MRRCPSFCEHMSRWNVQPQHSGQTPSRGGLPSTVVTGGPFVILPSRIPLALLSLALDLPCDSTLRSEACHEPAVWVTPEAANRIGRPPVRAEVRLDRLA
jgi:hypothetical protein